MIALLLVACGQEPQPIVRLPPPDGPLAPSAMVWRGAAQVEAFADVQRCAACHPEQAAGWAGSAHAHASFDNPWYRASVDAVRDEAGTVASRHCAGCHDPALLLAGLLDEPVDPGDPLARIGVPCLGCHGVTGATRGGNGSYTLDLEAIPFPPEQLEAHRQRMSPGILRSGIVCGACHRGFLDVRTGNTSFVSGIDDLGPAGASAFAGSEAARLAPTPTPRIDCVGCHLQGHAFGGGQTALAQASGHGAIVAEGLRDVAELYVVATPEGDELVVDLVVHNTGVGHAFPGGLADAQGTWLALEVLDADGVSIAAIREASDPRAHRLAAEVLDAEGAPERLHRPHRFAAIAWDHTVPSGDARAFRHRVPGGAHAARIVAELRHRPHRRELHAAACASTTADTLDGCAPQPELTLARAEGVPGASLSFDEAYAWGLALGHQRQEHLDEARRPLARALQVAPDDRARAAVYVELARLEGRQGRTAAALEAAAGAEALVGAHPAIDRVRGRALAQVWRWPEAAAALAPLATSTPGDVATWRDLALARGSAGDPLGALEATSAGLALAPRDPDLLRSQALALRTLDDPRWADAHAAWLAHRPRDDAAALRMSCDREVLGCAAARLPVPVTVVGGS